MVNTRFQCFKAYCPMLQSDVYSAYLHDAVILYTKLVAEVSPSDSGTSILDASRGRHFSGSGEKKP